MNNIKLEHVKKLSWIKIVDLFIVLFTLISIYSVITHPAVVYKLTMNGLILSYFGEFGIFEFLNFTIPIVKIVILILATILGFKNISEQVKNNTIYKVDRKSINFKYIKTLSAINILLAMFNLFRIGFYGVGSKWFITSYSYKIYIVKIIAWFIVMLYTWYEANKIEYSNTIQKKTKIRTTH